MKISSIIILVLLLLGCSKHKDLEQIYKNRSLVLSICKNKTLLKSRGNNFIVFKTYKADSVNEYYVYVENGVVSFLRDSIQYKPDIANFKLKRGTIKYRKEVCDYVVELDKQLKTLGINGFRTDFAILGEPLELYMVNGKIVVYAPDIKKISAGTDYTNRFKKLDGDWYFME